MKQLLYAVLIFTFILLLLPSNCQQKDEPDVNVKIIPANHFRMQKSDLSRLKQELEHNMKKKVALLEEQWTANEKLRERSSGVWNLRGSPMITPTTYGGPQVPQPWFLTNSGGKSNKNEEADQSENEKIADKLAKQLYMVNQAISQLKTSIDDSKKNLGTPIVKELKTIVHSPTRTELTAPRFQENTDSESRSNTTDSSEKGDISKEVKTNNGTVGTERFLAEETGDISNDDKKKSITSEEFFKDIFEEKEFKDISERLVKNESLTDLETPENMQEYRKENEKGITNLLSMMSNQKLKPESSYLEEGMKQYQRMATKGYTDFVNNHKEVDDYQFSEKEMDTHLQNGPISKPKDPSIADLIRTGGNSKNDNTKSRSSNGPMPRSSQLPQANGAVAGSTYGSLTPY